MALVLAIESNSVPADTLRHFLRTRADTDVVVVGSTEAAVAAIIKRVPDLVLVDALLSPRDENSFIAHLRTLPGAGHLQTLTIPQLRQASHDARRGLSIFGRRKRRREDKAAGGRDPAQFGDEVATYLSRACEVKAEIEQRQAAAPDGQVAAEAQAAQTLTTELAPVRASTERTLAGAEERRHADLARLETEMAEHSDVAARDAQAAAEARAAQTSTAELARVRADAERTLAAELAAAENRHRADIVRLEAEAAERSEAAVRDAQAAAEAQAAQTSTAELARARADAERTLVAELAAAENRHRADIVRLEAEAAERSEAAVRDAQAAAEAQAAQTSTAALARARADAERTLAAELAAAEDRHRAEIGRVRADARKTFADGLERVQAEANRARAEASRLAAIRQEEVARDAHVAAQAEADRILEAEIARVRAEAEHQVPITPVAGVRSSQEPSERPEPVPRSHVPEVFDDRSSGAGHRLLERMRTLGTAWWPVGRGSASAGADPQSPESVHPDTVDATDYYDLWRSRFVAAAAPPAEASVARPPRIDPRRRRWALSVAATLLILLTSNLESGSAPRHAVEAAGGSHATAPTRPLDQNGARMAPPGTMGRPGPWEPAAEDSPGTGVSGGAPLEQLVMEAMCVLVVMLLLRVALFVGEGFVWHGLVATLGLILVWFAVMRVPWGG